MTFLTPYIFQMNKPEERKLKLIWDFKGPDAARTAEHHALHLKEFIKNNSISLNITGFEKIHPDYYTAYLVVYESEMRPVRDALKPHRGQVYQE
jgi:hypothetical protein